MGDEAMVSSVAALAILINQGIGDTIRVSLTPDKMGVRTKEVEVCKNILSSLNLKQFKPKVVSCPGCGRTSSSYFIELTKDINKHIENNMIHGNLSIKMLKISILLSWDVLLMAQVNPSTRTSGLVCLGQMNHQVHQYMLMVRR